MARPKALPSTVKRSQQISARDKAALIRLRRRFDMRELLEIIQSLPDRNVVDGGAPPTPARRTRQCLLAFLYFCRCCCEGHISVHQFANYLDRTVEIKYARRIPLNYKTAKTLDALEKDIGRGLQEVASKDYKLAVAALLWWRFIHVNPRWPILISGRPQLLITPKQPTKLIRWIDAAIKLAGNSPELIKPSFQEALRNAPKNT
jgi:hypothetical protein